SSSTISSPARRPHVGMPSTATRTLLTSVTARQFGPDALVNTTPIGARLCARRDKLRRMELRQLRYFVAVAEELHFSRAAGRLSLAQSALSSQIRQLERELGGPLLVRSTRRVELTPAGESLLNDAREILAATDDALFRTRALARGEA